MGFSLGGWEHFPFPRALQEPRHLPALPDVLWVSGVGSPPPEELRAAGWEGKLAHPDCSSWLEGMEKSGCPPLFLGKSPEAWQLSGVLSPSRLVAPCGSPEGTAQA